MKINIVWFIYYVPLFIWECIKANLESAYKVAHPDLPVNPGIVKIKTALKSDTGLTFLANTITLRPGTMTVDLDKEKGVLYVHCANVEAGPDGTVGVDRVSRIAIQRFEKILERIFG